MSVSRKRIDHCNDCANKSGSGWRIVNVKDVTYRKERCEDVFKHEPRCRCGCQDKHHDRHDPCVPDECSKTDKQLTIVSAVNPTSNLIIPEAGVLPVPVNNVILNGWTLTTPDLLNSFNPATGVFTATESGDFEINLVLSFKSSASLSAAANLSNVPLVSIIDAATGLPFYEAVQGFPTTSSLVDVEVPVVPPIPISVTVTSVLGVGQVVLNLIVSLSAGQQVEILVSSNGLSHIPSSFPIGPATFTFNTGTSLIIKKVRNIPKVIYSLC
ncbi:hypothetical protein QJ850_gp340 [Acanthamoeba polyphaga mimivirus]|uniref:Uncharacterized protein n=1 Tax=Acanthamoeba polyphaga mimivirus Kroon TaxID=3069720 RepID=A0A0G2Y6Z4_9VIRU|nr:hypothetical protein QJ850_gp340 [Acanthamoeba polyphaga mimivirus]AKI80359.1 hypothetical protein [Acanthamoeba polyphaga mimivirus Kroon]